jgi:protein TonB
MTSMDQNRFVFPAWGISLTLHGLVVGVLFILAAQVKPVLQENLFQWDVALVESSKQESTAEQLEPGQTPEPQPVKRVIAARLKSVPEAPQPVMAVEPMQPTIEQVPAIQEKVEAVQVREEPIEPSLVEMTAPVAEPTTAAKEPESQPVQEEPVAVASAPVSPAEVSVAQEPPVQASQPPQSEEAAPAPMVKASVSNSELKMDHRWLADLLWRRVAELKRYPNTARMNGQEGKVIVKAVIRSDGHLADVFVQKSSGYSALDAAAVEAVRLACPLHMTQAIGKLQVVVSLPIVYSLAN